MRNYPLSPNPVRQRETRKAISFGLARSAVAAVPGPPANVLTREEMLDNVMLYWLPGTGASSARLYWESFAKLTSRPDSKMQVPVGCSVFPKDILRPSRRWAEKTYPDLRYWNEPAKGGHFAAPSS